MIVPMKHVTILCVAGEKIKALKKLSDLNVLHVETDITDSKNIFAARISVDEAVRAQNIINEAVSAKWDSLSLPSSAKEKSQEESTLVMEINTLADSYIAAREAKYAVESEIAKYERWGDFDPTLVEKLSREGINVDLFRINAGAELPKVDTGFAEALYSGKDGIFGVVVGSEMPDGFESVPLPKRRLADMISERDQLLGEMKDISGKLKSFASKLSEISEEINFRKSKEDYVVVKENMPASGVVAHISGYMDARKSDELINVAKEHAWGVEIRDPQEDEVPPTFVEPPKLFRSITALFGGLGILPGYTESDVSIVFYIFFSIFFAMLVGDAGYGAILLIATFVMRAKMKKKSGGVLSPIAKNTIVLFVVFSAATIGWGVLTGTYFGVPMDVMPRFLNFKSVAFFADQDNIMRFCFTLGAIQLSIARLWNALALFPSKKFISELGWFGIIWCMYCIICSIVISGFVLPSWVVPGMVGSILLVALFMLNRSELKTEGVNLGMLPLNVISSMGDIISYVRLFAVGLASVKVAENFNSMAVDLALPMWIKLPFMILILLLGHGMNMAMAALSVLVHAVRLNTLEFSGAKGVTWSGVPFKPFQSKITEKE